MNIKELIFKSNNDWTGFAIRLTLGIVIFPHGAQKLLGLFGGFGFNATIDFFTTQMGLPWIVAFLVIIIEFFGSISLIIGFASKIWSAAVIGLFTGIIFTTHLTHGFFMNWMGNQKGEGYEYALLVIGLAIAVVINGSGKYAVDSWLDNKVQKILGKSGVD